MRKSIAALGLAAFALAAGPGFASGNHAGGHHGSGHEDELAFGEPGDPGTAARTIEIEAADAMRFKPARIHVKRGETVRFVIRNAGNMKHELVLGDAKSLKEHAELMRKFPDMEHADANQVSVDPGKTGSLVWRFTKAGTVGFACLMPGHYEAGMVGKIEIAKK